MSAAAVARSSFETGLSRYSASRGLWLMLLVGPIGARFMVAQDNGVGIQVTVGRHLPVMTSATLGICLGIVVSTLLLPVAYLYLRSNVTRRQPWQVEEVVPGSRVAIALGRFGADVAILFGALATLTLAGWFLGWMIVTGPFDPWRIAMGLWLVAGPSMMGVAAFRQLVDAWRLTRGGWGDALFFLFWIVVLSVPAVLSALPSSFGANMLDAMGFVRPLVGPAPKGFGSFSIGQTMLLPGRVPLDVMAGVNAPGYLPSRLAWAAIAVAIAALAGGLYRPHVGGGASRKAFRLADLLAAPKPRAVDPGAPAAPVAANAALNLAKAEFRLIGWGPLFTPLAIGVALLGMIGDYRHVGSPAALLLLVFGLSAQAGRSESNGMRALAGSVRFSPGARRLAFAAAALAWGLLMALPAGLLHVSARPLLLGACAAAGAALVAIALAALSRAAFAPRLVLLILWYAYFSI